MCGIDSKIGEEMKQGEKPILFRGGRDLQEARARNGRTALRDLLL